MEKPFDIFWLGESGPVWVEAVQTLERAKACINALLLKDSGMQCLTSEPEAASRSHRDLCMRSEVVRELEHLRLVMLSRDGGGIFGRERLEACEFGF
jgi:hypothetical protein